MLSDALLSPGLLLRALIILILIVLLLPSCLLSTLRPRTRPLRHLLHVRFINSCVVTADKVLGSNRRKRSQNQKNKQHRQEEGFSFLVLFFPHMSNVFCLLSFVLVFASFSFSFFEGCLLLLLLFWWAYHPPPCVPLASHPFDLGGR